MMNAGAFIGPMIGIALSEIWGIPVVVLIGGAIRLGGAMLFYVFRVKVSEVDIR